MSRQLPVVAFLMLLPLTAGAAPRPVSWGELKSAQGADSPSGAIREYAKAFTQLSIPRLGALLTADFRSHIAGEEAVERVFPEGIDRATEMSVITGLVRGVRVRDTLVSSPAREVRVKAEGLVEGDDPEHPDSTLHYRLVAIDRFQFDIVTEDSTEYRGRTTLHVVHVVRGDAAVLLPGQPADARHWYIRRWLEDVNAVAAMMKDVQGDCAQEDEPLAGGLTLDIRPLRNPACPALDLTCELPESGPARLDVFDVMGRRVNGRDLPAGVAGPRRVQAGAGVSLAPGAYWVRLVQGGRRSTRMVIVAK
jgi:hypothetical protein